MPITAFVPPPTPPQLVQPSVAARLLNWIRPHPAKKPGPPIVIESHGWTYEVVWNSLLEPHRIRTVLGAAPGPKKAVSDLEAAYRKAGYFLVALRAAGHRKHVKISVYEGGFNQLSGPSGPASFYKPLLYDTAVNYNDLIRAGVLAQAYAGREGKRVHLNIAPGKAQGSSTLEVDEQPIPNYKPWSLNMVFGNYGNRYSNRYIGQVSASVNAGHGIQFFSNFSHGFPGLSSETRGSRFNQFEVGGSVINPWGIYQLSYQQTDYKIGDVAAPLYPTGETFRIKASGTQLLFASTTSRFSINEGFEHVDNNVTIYDGAYTLTDQRYNFLSLGAAYSHSMQLGNRQGSIAVSANLHQGISPTSGTLVRDQAGKPSPRFFYSNLDTTWQQSLPQNLKLQINGKAQWATDTLPSDERWTLGGLGSLSAYYPGVASGDSGYLLRAQLQSPTWKKGDFAVFGTLTYALGGAHNDYVQAGAPSWQQLQDVEFGVTVATKWNTNIQLTAALPTGSNNVPAKQRDQLRSNFYFLVNQSF